LNEDFEEFELPDELNESSLDWIIVVDERRDDSAAERAQRLRVILEKFQQETDVTIEGLPATVRFNIINKDLSPEQYRRFVNLRHMVSLLKA